MSYPVEYPGSFEDVAIPQLAMNGFLWYAMNQIDPSLQSYYPNTIPIYPLGDSSSGNEAWDNKPYLIYDRVFRFSSDPCYVKKRDSSLYYLKAREIDSLQWAAAIQAILDREDDAAKDINDWIRMQDNPGDYPVYFHNLRIYQARSSSASSSGLLREDSTVQPYYITEFIVDVMYHFTKELRRVPKVDEFGDPVLINGLQQYEYTYS